MSSRSDERAILKYVKNTLARVTLFGSSRDRTDANEREDSKIFQHEPRRTIPTPKTEVAYHSSPLLLSIELPEHNE